MASSSSANGAPLKKTESYSASKSAMAAIFGPDHRYSKANTTENIAEDSSAPVSGEEPPSGIKGKGTVGEPYDQGNAPDQIAANERGVNGTTSGAEPASGAKGKGTADRPYDQGNTGESTAGSQPINTSITNPEGTTTSTAATATAKAAPPPAATATTNGSSTTAAATTTAAAAASAPAATSQPPEQQQESRGRTLSPPSSSDRFERSVSPGTLPDGSHEQCSGEKGGSYTPSSGLGRLKDKFRSGK